TQIEQACYLQHGFHSLFDLTPSVAKVFWYQYQDTAADIEDKDCGNRVTSLAWSSGLPSPSWSASDAARYFIHASGATTVNIPWSFGLYDGNLKDTKPVRAAFTNYPTTDAACMATFPNLPTLGDLKERVYLPLITGNAVTATGQ
ncbi:MAG: hypothetical protein NT075_36510, partial [Chloroflexi bacterium]|nr:hypothetical protein [Chloroflexota bacterium]